MKNNLQDKKVLCTLGIAVLLVGLHLWQFIKSEYEIRALVNLIMTVVYIPVIILWGFEGVPYFLVAYAAIYLPLEEFDNYTSLFLLFSATSLKRKLKYLFIPYIIETIVCYMINGYEISHLCISCLFILFFYEIFLHIQDKHADVQYLELTIDEEKILEQLCRGREVKELEWSENTVYKKLREARHRNNCLTNDELKTRFKFRKII
ncbi:MAG: hypothetical protein MJZ11_07945 [Lachnospiraceae bacterium]|nr:hypothetical protein [Lachnospiraceae bacterium]